MNADCGTETALYRHWDEGGQLLYVGIALSPTYRLRKHKSSAWFRRIALITVEWLASRELASAAEVLAIKSEGPLENLAHNAPDLKPWPRRRAWPKGSPFYGQAPCPRDIQRILHKKFAGHH